ncbi:molybdotransferase-like divisome protein Glp [Luteococcus sp. Sow4_B9]|uniref:molybdotransferase-like divisome protein Glp n=1 Tax=Luteococcus sp. Sow4_B9 TaxID=3438792 RepID=UPI003F977E88
MALLRRKKNVVEEVVAPEPPPVLPEPPAPGPDGLRIMENHRDYLLSLVEPLSAFGMGLLDAWDLALCEDIASPVDLPGFDNSQMDGYAVLAADVASATAEEPVIMRVADSIAAGDDGQVELKPGQAIKIMTGAPMPAGADAVVPVESTDGDIRRVSIFAPVAAGDYVRLRGSDVTEGTALMSQGQRMDARTAGLLAAAGIDKVLARPRPRVVVVSTGAELVEPGRDLERPGQIYDANSYMVAAAAKAEGCQVWRVQVPSDDPEQVREAISDQLIRADLIITTGGVSKGDHDVVKQVMPTMGLCDFAEVAIQPGKPQGFGLIGDDEVPMIMLPGNPVSAYVSFQAFVRPVIRKLMGVEPQTHTPVRCIAGSVMRSVPGKLQFGRGFVIEQAGRRTVNLVGGHSSHLLGDLATANALVLLDEDVEVVNAGERVMVWMLDD